MLVDLAQLFCVAQCVSLVRADQKILGDVDQGRDVKVGGDKSSPFTAEFEELVNATLEVWKVPGLSIAVIDGDDVWSEVSSSLFA